MVQSRTIYNYLIQIIDQLNASNVCPVYRWALHIAALYGTSVSFLGSASSSSVETKILDNRSNIIAAFAPAPAPATSKPTAADDDLDDMFGDEGEGEALNDEGETAAEVSSQ